MDSQGVSKTSSFSYAAALAINTPYEQDYSANHSLVDFDDLIGHLQASENPVKGVQTKFIDEREAVSVITEESRDSNLSPMMNTGNNVFIATDKLGLEVDTWQDRVDGWVVSNDLMEIEEEVLDISCELTFPPFTENQTKALL